MYKAPLSFEELIRLDIQATDVPNDGCCCSAHLETVARKRNLHYGNRTHGEEFYKRYGQAEFTSEALADIADVADREIANRIVILWNIEAQCLRDRL